MRVKPIYVVTFAAMILALASALAFADGRPQLRIATDKEDYLLITLTNSGNAPFRYMDLINAEADTVRIKIIKGSNRFDYVPPVHYDFEREPATLAPGEADYSFTRIFLSNKGLTFDKAGDYKIKASFIALLDGRIVSSNEVKLTVFKPQSDADKAAFELISGGQSALFLYFQGGDHLTAGLGALYTLMDKCPGSVYADHVRAAVGVSLSKPFRSRRGLGPVRAADPLKAADLLESADDDVLSAAQIARKYVTLIRAYNDIGANADAVNVEERFRSRFAGTFAEKLFNSMSSGK